MEKAARTPISMGSFRKIVPITKIDSALREVSGIVTSETPDKTGEICDYAKSKPYYQAWSQEFAKATSGNSLGNLREMHKLIAVGKLTNLLYDDQAKVIYCTAKVVDEPAWQKCLQGVYTGFSHGGEYMGGIITDGEFKRYTAKPSEVSLVDNPCNPDAHFEFVKTDGTVELRKFKSVEQKVEKQSKEWTGLPAVIKKYRDAVDDGYKPSVEKKSPEGWEGTVEAMKDHPEIDNPWALANWMNDEGYEAHKVMEGLATKTIEPVFTKAEVRDMLKTHHLEIGRLVLAALNKKVVPTEELKKEDGNKNGCECDCESCQNDDCEDCPGCDDDHCLGKAKKVAKVDPLVAKLAERAMVKKELATFNKIKFENDEGKETAWNNLLTRAVAVGIHVDKVNEQVMDILRTSLGKRLGKSKDEVKTTLDELTKRDVSDKEREKLADKGHAMADGSYPIANTSDLHNAIQAIGRAKNPDKVKQHIKRRAKDLGATDAIPDTWKTVDATTGGLRKGLNEVARLASLILQMAWLKWSVQNEQTYEEDTASTLPADLQSDIESMAETFLSMAKEEVDELLAQTKTDKAPDECTSSCYPNCSSSCSPVGLFCASELTDLEKQVIQANELEKAEFEKDITIYKASQKNGTDDVFDEATDGKAPYGDDCEKLVESLYKASQPSEGLYLAATNSYQP